MTNQIRRKREGSSVCIMGSFSSGQLMCFYKLFSVLVETWTFSLLKGTGPFDILNRFPYLFDG